MENMIEGSMLSADDQKYVLSAYIHRYTKEHKPQWATYSTPVQFESNQEWLENTYFKVTKDGKLDKRVKYCQSCPTWPNNPELRK